ncbi:hypothetical protein D3C80_2003500 [compost metagenome]
MAQRDEIPGAFRRLNPGDTCGSKHITFVVAAVDNHGQRFRQHSDKGFGTRFAHRFGFGRDIHHMGFACGVNMGELRHNYFFK